MKNLEVKKYLRFLKFSKFYKPQLKKCEICDKEGDDVHHIKFQSNADEDGFVDHRHKNHYSNLVIWCKRCHQKVHKDKIEIRGYQETTEGVVLDYSIKRKKKT